MFTIAQVNKELPVSELSGQEYVVLFGGRDVLLATTDGVNRLPRAAEVHDLLPKDATMLVVGSIDGAVCCGMPANLDGVALPHDLSVVTTRQAFHGHG